MRPGTLGVDDSDVRAFFQLTKWLAVDDGRTCPEHLALTRCGILGTPFFLIDDPILAGWRAMVRAGFRPCLCEETPISRIGTKRSPSHLPRAYVQPPAFDPWADGVNCMLVGGIYPHPERIEDGVEEQRWRLAEMRTKGQMMAEERRF